MSAALLSCVIGVWVYETYILPKRDGPEVSLPVDGQRPINESRHFLYLDLMRGIAAIVVLLYHIELAAKGDLKFRGSFLAVDLFFLMSGFVLTNAYEAKLRTGTLTFVGFMQVRVLRLYPLYLVATSIGLSIYLFGGTLFADRQASAIDLLRSLPAALLALPNFLATDAMPSPFPYSSSAWSLSLEIWFNLLYALFIPRLSTRMLAVIVIAAVTVNLGLAWHFGSYSTGWGWSNLIGGVARFWSSFTLGILLFRLRGSLNMSAIWLPLLVPCGLAFAFIPHNAFMVSSAYILVVFPLITLVAANYTPPRWAAPICDHAGRLSYGLYILQAPLILIGAALVTAITGRPFPNFAYRSHFIILPFVIGMTAILVYGFDEPVRKWISMKLRARRKTAATNAQLIK
jgi:peptidoglycan/LPS O-acetylase OafA/YrhL